MILLIYIIKTVFISGGLLGYYMLCLRNRPFHGFNRIFLLSIPALSLIIPALHFYPLSLWNHAGQSSPIHLLGVARGTLEEAVTVYASRKKGLVFTWKSVSIIISTVISLALVIRLINSVRYLIRLKKQSPHLPLLSATLYFVSEKGTSFSFFKSIFWGKEMDLNNEEGQQILRHELYHVTQKHSLDILFMEICAITMWFNPFLYFIRSELNIIHEYAADSHATANADGYAYAKLLLNHISGNTFNIVHPFFKNQLKRRITMITKNHKNKAPILGRFLILPLLLIFITLFSFSSGSGSLKSNSVLSLINTSSIRVIIDPGHGGSLGGTYFNGLYEKDINLKISKKIQSLAKEYNVEVIMSRENDEDPAGKNLDASLNYRISLASTKNADLFISIHVNATAKGGPQKEHSGFEIYVPDNSSKFHNGSVKLASSITEYIKPDYTIASEIMERVHTIKVLDQATVPAVMIHCGFIDNPSDMSWIQNPGNQEKIARDILEGIQKYSQHISANTADTNRNIQLTEKVVLSENATTTKILDVKNEKQVSKELSITARDTSAPLRKVEVEAEYPGGSQQWVKYLFKTLKYPEAAVTNEIQGTVIVEFVVNEDGTLTDIHALNGPEQLRAESVRVLAKSGKWTPAKDQGLIVASYHKQPIIYKLEVKQ
jgi:TonB family protein